MFARTYSADKNVSTFLGRPYRMHRKHSSVDFIKIMLHDMPDVYYCQFEYTIDTRWTALCGMAEGADARSRQSREPR